MDQSDVVTNVEPADDAGTAVGTAENSTSTVLTDSDAGGDTAAADTSATDEAAAGSTGEEGGEAPLETYADFELPEGMTVDSVMLDKATPLFKEMGLNQEQAQKLVNLYAEQVQAGLQEQTDNFNQLMNDWTTQSKADREFGGDKFDENIKIARSAIEKLGTPEMKQLFEDHGIGNHPEMIRFMWKVGKLLGEDNPGSAGNSPGKPADRVSQMYPTTS